MASETSWGYECSRSCFETLDKTCSQCRICDDCENLTSRKYIKHLEQKIFNDLWPSVISDPNSSSVLSKMKDELFGEWGIDKKDELPRDIKFPGGVIVKDKDGNLDMALNSQLARKIIQNEKSDKKLMSLAERYLDLTEAGSKVEQQFRKEFQKEFNKIKGPRALKWNECFKYTNNLSIEDKDFCIKVNKIVDENYFKNDVFRYYLPIDQFNPRVDNSGAVNPRAFYSVADEGLKEGGSDLLICQKRLYAEGLPFERNPSCGSDPNDSGAFSDQIREIQHFSTHPSSRFLDLLRLEAIREHLRNYTNLTGELPPRKSLSRCNKPYGRSINNLYEIGVNNFNPEISSRGKNYPEIVKRNRAMIQHLFSLSYKAKKLFEVEKESCLLVDDEYICTESTIWKKNKPAYKEISNKISTILNEFPLLGAQINGDGEKYLQVYSKKRNFEKLLKLSDGKLLQKRKSILRKNIVKSLIKFCDLSENGFSSDDLIAMKGLRSITAKHFPGNKFIELGKCLEEMLKRKTENNQFLQTAKIIGCAGVSLAAGLFTSYAGGTGGVAAAIGLGCFGYETSVVYGQFHKSSVHLDNISGCMISSPDLPKGEITRICGSDEWEGAKRRYEQAAFDLQLQLILSPLEILPVIGDIKAARKASKTRGIHELLSQRDDLIDELMEAEKIGDIADVEKLKSSVSQLNENLKSAGVSADDLKVHYQSKGLGLEDSFPPSSKVTSNGDEKLPVTMDDPDRISLNRESINSDNKPPSSHIESDAPETLDDPDQISSSNGSSSPDSSSSSGREKLVQSDSEPPITLDDPDQISSGRESGPITQDDPDQVLDGQSTRPERPTSMSRTNKRKPPHPLDVDFFNKTKEQILADVEKTLVGLNEPQVSILKSLDRGTIARIGKLADQGGDLRELAKKLISPSYKHQGGLIPLELSEIEGLAFNVLEIIKADKKTGGKLLKLLTQKEITLHTMDKFIKNCRRNRSCKDLIRKLEDRLKIPGIHPSEVSLLHRSPGPYIEHYISIAKDEPLGKFVGKGGFGAVFCRGNRPSCDQVIKIPLAYHSKFIHEIEVELAQEYLKHGRAAKILSDPDEVIMIKEFIGGREAGEILLSGENYSAAQVDDIVELFFDLRETRMRNRNVLYADIKGNNLKWDPEVNKWVFVDTGARSPRNMFDDPDEFYDAFAREFFFPSWVQQSDAQLKTSMAQWRKACKEIISRLIGSVQARLNPMCSKTP